jgi:hypothetical protein
MWLGFTRNFLVITQNVTASNLAPDKYPQHTDIFCVLHFCLPFPSFLLYLSWKRDDLI